ncbi:hypothetical protein DPMN_136635 [Dreissena polymorpha]|uniref:Uncharacterized protein n=1 Tax=Dreissena polymorpha TaxID=45954 RepID=A0A9D4JI12_DREPO|nr:hypothetical protein DPMN_136635 [Dreissena polymorpha]
MTSQMQSEIVRGMGKIKKGTQEKKSPKKRRLRKRNCRKETKRTRGLLGLKARKMRGEMCNSHECC